MTVEQERRKPNKADYHSQYGAGFDDMDFNRDMVRWQENTIKELRLALESVNKCQLHGCEQCKVVVRHALRFS